MNEMITISKAEYSRLREAAEDLADLQSYDRVMAAIESGEEELIPAEFVKRLLADENALKVYRELRGLTQIELAEKAGVHRVTVSEVEIGRKQGSINTLNKLAVALNVAVDDLIA